MEIQDRVYRELEKESVENIVVTRVRNDTRQLRFSTNVKDVLNVWNEDLVTVFGSLGKRVASTTIKNYGTLESQVSKFAGMLRNLPENDRFGGINPEKQDYSRIRSISWHHPDIDELAERAVKASLDTGAARNAGFVYTRNSTVSLRTPFNDAEYSTGDVELVIRAFTGDSTGQEALHFGPDSLDQIAPEDAGSTAARMSLTDANPGEGQPGRYRILMSPYLIGNILSYCSRYFSQYEVDSHLSPFEGKLGESVAADALTLTDDPGDYAGAGAVPVDEEGTLTRSNVIIENGILKKFLQSYSTSRESGTEPTGNAGIISPTAFQLKVRTGRSSFEDMLSGLDDGLYIGNAWYTRFQDYRNGIFSTVPRDGVFRVLEGRIVERWSGIRISDSFTRILSNIEAVSNRAKRVKWWEEIMPSMMPDVMVRDVEISRSF